MPIVLLLHVVERQIPIRWAVCIEDFMLFLIQWLVCWLVGRLHGNLVLYLFGCLVCLFTCLLFVCLFFVCLFACYLVSMFVCRLSFD